VYILIRTLLARAAVGSRALHAAAIAGALAFAIHPLRVESVAWATARRDVLSGLFYLLTILTYLRMASERDRGGGWSPWFVASLACFTLSLLAKTWGVTLPFVLLALDVYPLRRWSRGALAEKAAYGVVAAAGRHADRAADRRRPLHVPRLSPIGGARRRGASSLAALLPPGSRGTGRARRAHVAADDDLEGHAGALGACAPGRPGRLLRAPEPRLGAAGARRPRGRLPPVRRGAPHQPEVHARAQQPRQRLAGARQLRRRDRGFHRGDRSQPAVRVAVHEPRHATARAGGPRRRARRPERGGAPGSGGRPQLHQPGAGATGQGGRDRGPRRLPRGAGALPTGHAWPPNDRAEPGRPPGGGEGETLVASVR